MRRTGSRAIVAAVQSSLARRPGLAVSFAVLVAPLAACSLIVSTDGLTGDGEPLDGAPATEADAGGLAADGAVILGTPEASATSSPDAFGPVYNDAAPTADAAKKVDAGTNDSSTIGPAFDAGLDANGGEGSDAGDAADAGHDAGKILPAGDGSPCSGDLSFLGTGNFSIAFGLRTTQSGRAALLNQRSTCGPSVFWDVRFSSGQIEAEVDDGASDTDLTTTGPQVNDGASHDIVVARADGTLAITIDGRIAGSQGAGESLGALPRLATGTDVCDGQDGTAAFEGTLTVTCVGDL